jgi:hypothetical protein
VDPPRALSLATSNLELVLRTDHRPLWSALVDGADPRSLPVIIVRKSVGGWHPATVLTRRADSTVSTVAPWDEPCLRTPQADWGEIWNYLADRIRTGAGGNGYSYEVTGIVVNRWHDIEPAVVALAVEILWDVNGPFG